MTRTCKYEPCSKEFEPRRPHQVFCSDKCRYADWVEEPPGIRQGGVQRVGEHPLDEVRAEAEASREKSRWTIIAREHMSRTLLGTGYFSSEDFDALGIPPEHVNVGNSQMGIFSKKGYMDPITWRRSSKASRKSGKIWTYRVTEKGRQELSKLVGVGTDGGPSAARVAFPPATDTAPAPPVSSDPGENSTGVPGPDQAVVRGGGAGSPEPLTLLPEPDPETWAA